MLVKVGGRSSLSPGWDDNNGMHRIRLRYWAGAETAAGTESESLLADTPRQALEAAARARAGTPAAAEFERVLSVSSFLVDGRRLGAAELERPVAEAEAETVVEVLPPFAGG